jgi:pimeloyl-ACP methyl ester carboxylesterase
MDKTLTVEGRELFYRDLGVGAPVLLLHGFAEDGAVWDEVAEVLTGMCRVLIPDLPGSGLSTLPETVSMESLAAALKALLDRESIDQCVFIGHSMGGYITLAFAEIYPERVSAFGFFHSTAYADSDEKKAGRRKSMAFICEHGVASYIRQSAPNLFAAVTRAERPELVERMVRRYSSFSAGSLTAYLEAMLNRPERLSVLEGFPRPILFIVGEQDQIVPMEQSLKQVSIPRIAQVRILRDAGHMGMLEDAGAGGIIIREFLNFSTLS